MKKLPFAALLGALFLSGAVNATDFPYGHDSDPDACGAVLCLLGMTRDCDCDKYIKNYFGI